MIQLIVIPMNTKTMASLFVLSAIISIAVTVPSAYAAHADTAVVEMTVGSGMPGCEETMNCYFPHSVTIAAGGHVEWINNDTGMYHTATSGGSPMYDGEGPDGVFDSGMMMAGDKFREDFSDAGEYSYYCTMHPWMTGVVTVEEESHDDHGDGHAEEVVEETHAEEVEVATLTGADISISVPESADADERVAIDVTINGEHVNYDIVATHGGEEILNESYHSHDGTGTHTTSALSAAASDDLPIDVTVTFQGFGMPDDEKTGPIGLSNSAKVVPEFGTIAAMILAVAIVSIIAVTAKSRLSIMPRI